MGHEDGDVFVRAVRSATLLGPWACIEGYRGCASDMLCTHGPSCTKQLKICMDLFYSLQTNYSEV